jgi:hypothetical protein
VTPRNTAEFATDSTPALSAGSREMIPAKPAASAFGCRGGTSFSLGRPLRLLAWVPRFAGRLLRHGNLGAFVGQWPLVRGCWCVAAGLSVFDIGAGQGTTRSGS